MIDQNIRERFRKVDALRSSPNPGEAQAAEARYQDMLGKYGDPERREEPRRHKFEGFDWAGWPEHVNCRCTINPNTDGGFDTSFADVGKVWPREHLREGLRRNREYDFERQFTQEFRDPPPTRAELAAKHLREAGILADPIDTVSYVHGLRTKSNWLVFEDGGATNFMSDDQLIEFAITKGFV